MNCKVAMLIVASLLCARPLLAHHSFTAEYDANKPVTLTGVVTRIEWTNPHAHVLIDAKDDRAETTTWKIELASPKVLVQNGWRAPSLKIGDEVTVEGWLAKDGSTRINARIVILADGRRVSAGSSGGDLPIP